MNLHGGISFSAEQTVHGKSLVPHLGMRSRTSAMLPAKRASSAVSTRRQWHLCRCSTHCRMYSVLSCPRVMMQDMQSPSYVCAEGKALYLGWPGEADWNTCAGRRAKLLPNRLAGTLQGARVGARRYTSARSHRSDVQHCAALCAIRGMMWTQGTGAAGMQMPAAHLTSSMFSVPLCWTPGVSVSLGLGKPFRQCIHW